MTARNDRLEPQTEILAFVVKNIDKLSRMSLRELKNFLANLKRSHPHETEVINMVKQYIAQKKAQL
jgi:excinuclease UvrABC ATPase subunit